MSMSVLQAMEVVLTTVIIPMVLMHAAVDLDTLYKRMERHASVSLCRSTGLLYSY